MNKEDIRIFQEHAVGDVFEYEGKRIKVEKCRRTFIACTGCIFEDCGSCHESICRQEYRPDRTEVIFTELPDGLDGSNGSNGQDGSDGHTATDGHHTDDQLAAVSAQQDFGDLGVAPADTTTTTGIPSAAPSESDSAVPIAPKTAQPTNPTNPINPILVEKATAIPATLYRRLDYLGIIPNDIRSHNVGSSNYSAHLIQPWAIWLDYPDLTSWDHNIIKRVLRTKSTDPRITDYEKIIHICQERIRQLRHAKPSD